MQTPSQLHDEPQVHSPKIIFSQKTFGKPTKNRTEDPSMFQLLTWNASGVQQSNFKRNERFTDPQSAYLNMISKQPWISECQQSYLNFHSNSIDVNQDVFQEVQNYIQSHESKNTQKKGLQGGKQTKKAKGNSVVQHQNRGQKDNFISGNEKVKVTGPNHKQNNLQGKQWIGKQNGHLKSNDMRKRPTSARNISNITSPKGQYNKNSGFMPETQQRQSSIQKRDEISQEQQQKLIQKFKQTTRWIPNSSFTTYFGRPPFQNYGRGNTKPVDGGLIYGTYLYSHNVHPHRGSNSPSHVQTYPVALMKAKSMGRLIPTQPKTACKFLQNKVNNEKERQYDGSGAIEALKNNFNALQIQIPDLHGVQKFGGSKTGSKTNFYPQSANQAPSGYEGSKYSKKRI